MKYTFTILFLCAIRIVEAQFQGGNGSGFVHANLNGYCAFISYSPFFGGASGGFSSEANATTCVIITPSPFTGGIADGFSRSRIGTGDCSSIAFSPFFGGFSDGYSNKKIDSIPCLIFTPTPFGGGIADGFSMSHLSGDYACEVVTYSPFFGGFSDGYANEKLIPIVCEIVTPTPFAGATADGFARGSLIQTDMVTCEKLTPLPIELLSWDAIPEENKVLTKWTTASERNNDFFTVERTLDGKEWIEIGEIPGAGNSNYKLNYQFYDLNPIIGIQYYKLKQTDFNGEFTYSDVKSVAFYRYNNQRIAVFPNPSSGVFTMEIYGDEITNGTIRILNVSGKLIEEVSSLSGNSFVFDISTHSLGMYLIELEVNSKTQRIKLIKTN